MVVLEEKTKNIKTSLATDIDILKESQLEPRFLPRPNLIHSSDRSPLESTCLILVLCISVLALFIPLIGPLHDPRGC